VIIVQSLDARLDDKFTVDISFLDQRVDDLEVPPLEEGNAWVVG
jgi:hypothetical protein